MSVDRRHDLLAVPFMLSLGTFILDTDTRVRLDSDDGLGTQIDWEEDIGSGEATRIRFDGTWRFTGRNKLRALWFSNSVSRSTRLEEEVSCCPARSGCTTRSSRWRSRAKAPSTESRWLDASAQFFYLSIDDYQGGLQDYRVAALWQPRRWMGVGFGYSQFTFDVDVEKEGFNGSLDWTYRGPLVFYSASF